MLSLTVKEVIQEAPDTITLVLDVPPYSWDYEAGQFITLVTTVGDESLRRSYSLCTSPYKDPLPAITIKRVAGGKVSNFLHDYIKKGSTLTAFAPKGSFVIDYQPHKKRDFVFIGGGSGITPLFSMIKAVLQQEPQSSVTLIYANRNESSIIYRRQLADMEGIYGDRVQFIHILSQPTPAWKGRRGRLNAAILQELLKPIKASLYFLCGPTGLMELASVVLYAKEVPEENIRQERFFTPKLEPSFSVVSSQLTVAYEGESYTCEVAPGNTLLDTLLDQGIDVPYSCSSGMCNSCRVKCTKGAVHMLADEGLSATEKEAGYVLTCVGYPTSEEVELEVE